jgi:hypothetical protein
MVITSRARLLVVCALLSLPPVGDALADPQIKPPIRGLVSMGAYRFVGKGATRSIPWSRSTPKPESSAGW